MECVLMPIFWRYLSKTYLKVFLLSTISFISLLLLTRLKEIARYAALAHHWKNVFLFILYQIPHILPIAIPISCLISSILLFQKLSWTHELTALRTGGLSLKTIIFPLLSIAFFLFLINFFICSEITTFCRQNSKKLVYEQSSINPLLLLQRQDLLKIKNSYIDMEISDDETTAKDLIFILPNKANHRLSFMHAKKLTLQGKSLEGENISTISHIDSIDSNYFDPLILENQKIMTTTASSISQFMKSSHFPLTHNHLPLKLLLVRSKLEKEQPTSSESITAEISRRFAFGFSAFSFTFIGICYGIKIQRFRSKKGIFWACFLALLILISFVIGKALKYNALSSSLIYLLPQPLILLFASRMLRKISKGAE